MGQKAVWDFWNVYKEKIIFLGNLGWFKLNLINIDSTFFENR